MKQIGRTLKPKSQTPWVYEEQCMPNSEQYGENTLPKGALFADVIASITGLSLFWGHWYC